MKTLTSLFLSVFIVLLISSCVSTGPDVDSEYLIESRFIASSQGADDSTEVFGLFEEVKTRNQFLVLFKDHQDTLFSRGWTGQLGLNKVDSTNYYFIVDIIP